MIYVICEGKDDEAVIKALCNQLEINNIRIEVAESKSKLRTLTLALPQRPEFAQQEVTALGIIRDADLNGQNEFTSSRNALRDAGFQDVTFSGGISPRAAQGSSPAVGVFIVGKENEGMLEDLCLESIEMNPAFPCLVNYVNCFEQAGNRIPTNKLSKAKLRAWMAMHDFYDITTATSRNHWDFSHPVFVPLKQFLRDLAAAG